MKKLLVITTLLAAVTGAALYAGPGMRRMHGDGAMHDGMHFGGGGFMRHLHEVAGELDLSDGQKTQIHGIFKEVHEQNADYVRQLHGGFHSVAKALIANPNDLSGAQAVLDQQEATERIVKQNMLRGAAKALNVLTAEQRTKLARLVAERENRRDRD